MLSTFLHMSNLAPKFFFLVQRYLTFNVVVQSCLCCYELSQMDKRVFNAVDMEHHVYNSFVPNLRSNFPPNFTLI